MSEFSWVPKTAAQKLALDCAADILFFGGAAGSLKTETMLIDAVQERESANLRGIVFRQTYPQMSDIIEKTRKLYDPMGAKYVGSPTWMWTFPSGATVRLAYMESDADVMNYLGPRYSFIGFDESTLHTEYQIRNILGRLSSTDRRLKLRMRLASNPGNQGAGWHKKMFLRDSCPVHEASKCAAPGELYSDAKWPSDGYPLTDEDGNGFSVAFIPGRLTDHNLLDDKYIYRLRMMSGSLSAAMEQGCWCSLQGAYFACWDKHKMVKPYASIGENWWDTHWFSIDYGFGKSHASAHLHVRLQNGKCATIAEYVAAHMPAYEFAEQVAKRFTAEYQGERRRIVTAYLDPSNFKEIGDGHTIADQISSVFLDHGLPVCTEASNDRQGGWQLMYRLLASGEWAVADTCPDLIDAIPSRVHDEKKPGDILKVSGDKLDDVCLTGDTLIETEHGQIPIMDVQLGVRVHTRNGLRSVVRSWQTATNAPTLRVELSNGEILSGTANHPVWVAGAGWRRLDSLRYGDKLLSWQEVKRSYSTESLLGDTQTPSSELIAFTIPRAARIGLVASGSFIRRCGKQLTAKFLPAVISITKTAIRSITTLPTSNARWGEFTLASTSGLGSMAISNTNIWQALDRWPHGGIRAQKAWSGTGSTPVRSRLTASPARMYVRNAVPPSPAIHCKALSSVPTSASRNGGAIKGLTILGKFAKSAIRRLCATATPTSVPALVRVERVYAGENADVFNLEVEGAHEFFAGGVLVHNCDEVRYGLYSFMTQSSKPASVKRAEVMERFKDDPMNTALRMMKLEAEIKKEQRPMIFGGSARRAMAQLQRNRRAY